MYIYTHFALSSHIYNDRDVNMCNVTVIYIYIYIYIYLSVSTVCESPVPAVLSFKGKVKQHLDNNNVLGRETVAYEMNAMILVNRIV